MFTHPFFVSVLPGNSSDISQTQPPSVNMSHSTVTGLTPPHPVDIHPVKIIHRDLSYSLGNPLPTVVPPVPDPDLPVRQPATERVLLHLNPPRVTHAPRLALYPVGDTDPQLTPRRSTDTLLSRPQSGPVTLGLHRGRDSKHWVPLFAEVHLSSSTSRPQ